MTPTNAAYLQSFGRTPRGLKNFNTLDTSLDLWFSFLIKSWITLRYWICTLRILSFWLSTSHTVFLFLWFFLFWCARALFYLLTVLFAVAWLDMVTRFYWTFLLFGLTIFSVIAGTIFILLGVGFLKPVPIFLIFINFLVLLLLIFMLCIFLLILNFIGLLMPEWLFLSSKYSMSNIM